MPDSMALGKSVHFLSNMYFVQRVSYRESKSEGLTPFMNLPNANGDG